MLTPAPPHYALLSWLNSSPDWLREAYLTDSTVQRSMQESANRGHSEKDMLLALCARLYELKNCWEATAMEQTKRGTSPPKSIPIPDVL